MEELEKKLFLQQAELYAVISKKKERFWLHPDDIDLFEFDNRFYITEELFCFIAGKEALFNCWMAQAAILGIEAFFKKEGITYLSLLFTQCLLNLKVDEHEKKLLGLENTKSKFFNTYLMKDSHTGYIKIGKAMNPNKREKSLKCGNPTIKLIAVCNQNIETKLHQRFKDKRVSGEWFNLSNNDILDLINEFNFKITK